MCHGLNISVIILFTDRCIYCIDQIPRGNSTAEDLRLIDDSHWKFSWHRVRALESIIGDRWVPVILVAIQPQTTAQELSARCLYRPAPPDRSCRRPRPSAAGPCGGLSAVGVQILHYRRLASLRRSLVIFYLKLFVRALIGITFITVWPVKTAPAIMGLVGSDVDR